MYDLPEEGGKIMEQRQCERVSAVGSVTCAVDGVVSQNQLCDLSVNGCRLLFREGAFSKGQEVDITLLGDISLPGVVRWAIGSQAGIEFDDELSEVAVRYFATPGCVTVARDTTFDGFGRRLPPLSPMSSTSRIGS